MLEKRSRREAEEAKKKRRPSTQKRSIVTIQLPPVDDLVDESSLQSFQRQNLGSISGIPSTGKKKKKVCKRSHFWKPHEMKGYSIITFSFFFCVRFLASFLSLWKRRRNFRRSFAADDIRIGIDSRNWKKESQTVRINQNYNKHQNGKVPN